MSTEENNLEIIKYIFLNNNNNTLEYFSCKLSNISCRSPIGDRPRPVPDIIMLTDGRLRPAQQQAYKKRTS